MAMKFYYDLLSQPCRALYIVLQASKIPYEACPIPLKTGMHLSESFAKDVSKFQKLPVIHDKDFRLTESVAILKYLANEKNLSDKFYPKDSKSQARVDEFLSWQHHNIRGFCTGYFRMKWLMPLITGQQSSERHLKGSKQNMSDNLDLFESLWLSDDKFITGGTPNAADIWAACEIEQTRIAGYNPCEGRPYLEAWLQKVREEPFYKEAHTIVEAIISKQ
ncbi:PREDICTED: glutathione S-transferase theta-1-like [Nicrophorus vespilloides]|uniref:Glutathione S-transferase theta-1-like n=1 Tax=Nicrophorus vespilloides TaxID=110193 RepID=A0ABM1MBT8_NICVS|nr:PREDICTED: glutathione S-transferase theta-1-like [Nicrophorus vespilloides]